MPLNEKTFLFLTDLQTHNNREWFNDNKERYLEAKADTLQLIEELLEEIAHFDPEIVKINAEKTLFRIYRDTRFSKDKSPYKTNFGAAIGMGKSSPKAGYYLHIEPGKSFLAGGFHRPESTLLKKIRQDIVALSDDFKALITHPNFRESFQTLDTELQLSRVPQGFDKDHPMKEFLKLKSFTARLPLSDYELQTLPPKHLANHYKTLKPLNDFINGAIDA
ncbi:DUF2461 domain-containing protein [Bergeyella sp. RCAD1439]|uniref:DUF2461 domain-containing protein n=1 Tax=Bergeyella anatis TaxID=3113737 RepID=UPI002E17F9DE|nr:DUF2461 domain-containing protein [Bergeyella sp. RCAD1439]